MSGRWQRSKRAKPPPLSRQRIFEAALELADRQGATAVTMRRIAGELGVQAMSLYHHVRDREDLLDGMAETMVSGLPTPLHGGPVRELLRGFANGIRSTALTHPDAFHLVGLRPLRSAAAGAAIEGLLNALAAGGMTPDLAVIAYRVTAAYARGFALAEIAGLTFGPGVDTPIPDTLQQYATALHRDTGEVFEAGLEAILNGILSGLE